MEVYSVGMPGDITVQPFKDVDQNEIMSPFAKAYVRSMLETAESTENMTEGEIAHFSINWLLLLTATTIDAMVPRSRH